MEKNKNIITQLPFLILGIFLCVAIIMFALNYGKCAHNNDKNEFYKQSQDDKSCLFSKLYAILIFALISAFGVLGTILCFFKSTEAIKTKNATAPVSVEVPLSQIQDV